LPEAEARIETAHASRYLLQLCEHLNEKVAAHPEMRARVEWSEGRGTAEFGWGSCSMLAEADALLLRATGEEQDGLEQIEELITRHLERHGADERLTVSWQQDGMPARPSDARVHRRDRMREFHRRARG
jgi:uncharacterized protein